MSMAIAWLIVLVACLGIEIATLGLSTIWFAIGALAATIAALLGTPLWVQLVLFVLVSIVFLLFTRPVAVKYFNKDRARTNVEGLIGCTAIVLSEIDNLHGAGRVVVNGQDWSARAEKEDGLIPAGCVVNVVGVSGVKLIVKEKEN